MGAGGCQFCGVIKEVVGPEISTASPGLKK